MELDGSRTASSAGKLAGVLERGTDLFAELQHEESSIPPSCQSASESCTLMRAHWQQPSIRLRTLRSTRTGVGVGEPAQRASESVSCSDSASRVRGGLRPALTASAAPPGPVHGRAGRRPPGRHEPSEGVYSPAAGAVHGRLPAGRPRHSLAPPDPCRRAGAGRRAALPVDHGPAGQVAAAAATAARPPAAPSPGKRRRRRGQESGGSGGARACRGLPAGSRPSTAPAAGE